MALKRFFYALLPDAGIKAQISAVQARFAAVGVRPVVAENFHITVAFLGQQEESRMQQLHWRQQLKDWGRHSLSMDRIGWFPRSRVCWLGPAMPPAGLLAAQSRFNRWLGEQELPTENRKWSPHVTLYRKMRMAPETISLQPIVWHTEAPVLMESILTPAGARYQSYDG